MRCFIFGALDVAQLLIAPQKDDMIIAADKGLKTLEKFSLLPTVIIGDFDSLGHVPESENVIKLPTQKDDTDTGYAIKYALEKGCDSFIIYGALDGKLDLTMASIQLSCSLAQKGMKNIFIGASQKIASINSSSLVFPASARGRISVFAAEPSIVSETGLKYSLSSYPLTQFFPLGVSNSFKNCKSRITAEKGTVTAIWDDDVFPEKI